MVSGNRWSVIGVICNFGTTYHLPITALLITGYQLLLQFLHRLHHFNFAEGLI